jgi:hypothetical protein
MLSMVELVLVLGYKYCAVLTIPQHIYVMSPH